MKHYIVYCDGSYMDSLKAGGWSAIILDEKENVVDILYQGFKNTSNNRMEIMAVLETLRYFSEPVKLDIFSDSQYVVLTIREKRAER